MKYLNRKNLDELCAEAGITRTSYYYRRRKGMSHEEALTTPKKQRTRQSDEERIAKQRIRQRLKRGVPKEFANLSKEELIDMGYLKYQLKIFLFGEPLKDFCEKRGLKYNSVYVFIKRHGIEKAEEKYGNDKNNKGSETFATL